MVRGALREGDWGAYSNLPMSFKTLAEAARDARSWAKDEGVDLDPGLVSHLKLCVVELAGEVSNES